MDVVVAEVVSDSTIDYLGKSAAVIYFGGCNFRCRHCFHHKILDQATCLDADYCRQVPTEQLFDEVMSEGSLIDAVVFSGGEPCFQPGALSELVHMFKHQGLAVKIDTNGSNSKVMTELISANLVDHVALSVKTPMEMHSDYAHLTGVNAEKAIHEMLHIMKLKAIFPFTLEVVTTVIPEFMHHHHQVELIAQEVKPYADIYSLHQFINEKGTLDPEFSNFASPSRQELIELARYAKRHVKEVRIKTSDMGIEKV